MKNIGYSDNANNPILLSILHPKQWKDQLLAEREAEIAHTKLHHPNERNPRLCSKSARHTKTHAGRYKGVSGIVEVKKLGGSHGTVPGGSWGAACGISRWTVAGGVRRTGPRIPKQITILTYLASSAKTVAMRRTKSNSAEKKFIKL